MPREADLEPPAGGVDSGRSRRTGVAELDTILTGDKVVLVVFVIVYLGMLLGEIPGLALDRTGIALLGARALVATERVTPAAATVRVKIDPRRLRLWEATR